MEAKIALAQTTSSKNYKENLEKARTYMERAKKADAKMIVFPEYFMTYYPDEQYTDKAQTLDGPFVQKIKYYTKTYGLWTVFGMNQQSENKNKSYNTLVVLDNLGEIKGTYHKTHLFDAYSWKESGDTVPGEKFFEPIDTPFGKMGLATCYDLRYPEVARHAFHGNASLMIYSSAWVQGEDKLTQWKALLQARAIENQMYVLGCNHVSKTYMGYSYGVDPMGNYIIEGSAAEDMFVATIDSHIIEKVRRENPIRDNQRTDLYD